MNTHNCHRPKPGEDQPVPHDDYGDGDIPEIDTSHFQSNASDAIPSELPPMKEIHSN